MPRCPIHFAAFVRQHGYCKQHEHWLCSLVLAGALTSSLWCSFLFYVQHCGKSTAVSSRIVINITHVGCCFAEHDSSVHIPAFCFSWVRAFYISLRYYHPLNLLLLTSLTHPKRVTWESISLLCCLQRSDPQETWLRDLLFSIEFRMMCLVECHVAHDLAK